MLAPLVYSGTLVQLHLMWKPLRRAWPAHCSLSRPSNAESFRAQHTLALWCPEYMRMASPVDRSHRRALQSEEAVTR